MLAPPPDGADATVRDEKEEDASLNRSVRMPLKRSKRRADAFLLLNGVMTADMGFDALESNR